MTIVNIRGTGGSGKSTVVRRFMEGRDFRPVCVPDRKRPLYYLKDGTPRTLVIGHYETACGGCDTLKTVGQVFDVLQDGVDRGYRVLFEGIMVGDDVRRTVELAQTGHEVVVVGLTTPVDVCLSAIAERRAARGDERPLDPKNTVSRHERLQRHYARLAAGGVRVERRDRDGALALVRELLG